MNSDTFLQRAIELAIQHSADGRHGPFGAVIVKDGEIVAEGWNQVIDGNDPTAHAEIMAIRKASETLQSVHLHGCIIYSSCEPCPMCLAAMYWAKLDKVVFAASQDDAQVAGFQDSMYYEEMCKSWDKRRIVSEQRLRSQGQRVFELWLQNPKRVEY